jgi:hypothetical protein
MVHLTLATGQRGCFPSVLEQAGITENCDVIGGSFFDMVPRGADAYLVKSISHDWDDASAVEILGTCRTAIADTGKVLPVERAVLCWLFSASALV